MPNEKNKVKIEDEVKHIKLDNRIYQGKTIFTEDAQLKSLVQLRMHQDNIVYSRINALLVMNSMLILTFVHSVVGKTDMPIVKMEMAIVIAIFGILVNCLVGYTLIRQNDVLDYNIACVNHLWVTANDMEKLWGKGTDPLPFIEKFRHARFLLTKIVPLGFILFWFAASCYPLTI